jgi:hypothetical protein
LAHLPILGWYSQNLFLVKKLVIKNQIYNKGDIKTYQKDSFTLAKFCSDSNLSQLDLVIYQFWAGILKAFFL